MSVDKWMRAVHVGCVSNLRHFLERWVQHLIRETEQPMRVSKTRVVEDRPLIVARHWQWIYVSQCRVVCVLKYVSHKSTIVVLLDRLTCGSIRVSDVYRWLRAQSLWQAYRVGAKVISYIILQTMPSSVLSDALSSVVGKLNSRRPIAYAWVVAAIHILWLPESLRPIQKPQPSEIHRLSERPRL